MFKLIEIINEKKSNELFDLYSVNSCEINDEIKKKLLSFQSSDKFFEYYTKKNINQLLFPLSEFNSNLSELFDENQNIYESKTDKYISTLSKIYLSLNLIHKIHEVLTDILELTKNCYSKLISENKYQRNNTKSINEYINELIDAYSSKNYILYTPKFSNTKSQINEKLLSLNNHLNEKSKNYCNFFKTKNKSQTFFNNKKLDLINTICKTSEVENGNNNQIKKIDGTLIVNEGQFSYLTLKEMKFIIEKHDKSKKEKDLRKMNTSLKKRVEILPDKRVKKNKCKTFVENSCNKGMCLKLLEVIIDLYKNCIINSEEKLRLKQLIISKSKKIEQVYMDYFIFFKYDKNEFITKLKKL